MFVGYSSIYMYIASTLMHKYLETKLDIDFYRGFFFLILCHILYLLMKDFPFYFISIKLWVHVFDNFAAYISNLFEFSLNLIGLKFSNM